MALNVKAAMIICMAFIGGMSWLAQQFAGPSAARGPAPLAAVANAYLDRAPVASDAGYRSGWQQQFARPNAMEREAAQRAAQPAERPIPPAEPVAVEDPAFAALPPLIVHTNAAVASADVLPDEPPPLPDFPSLPIPGSATAAGQRYRVAKGDTLATIARRAFNRPDAKLVELLVAANPALAARKDRRINVNEEIAIPDAAAAARFLAGQNWQAEAPAASAALPTAQIAPTSPATDAGQWYTIRANDTLAGIATKFLKDSRRWREIVEANRALDPQRIVPGMRIRIPSAARMARG
jgi:nucleoid-associated protein YgaU